MITVSSFPVAARTKANIENITTNYLRERMPQHLAEPEPLDVEELLNVHLSRSHGFMIDLVPELENKVEAQVVLQELKIQFTEQGWERVMAGVPRSRFTGCHEAYHVIDHSAQILGALLADEVSFLAARNMGAPKVYCDPEWQANYGAGALLMPLCTVHPFVRSFQDRGALPFDIKWEVSRAYGVSLRAAETRIAKIDFRQ